MIDREEPKLSLVRQCALLGISRSSLYYLPTEAGAEDLELMALIDQQYLKTPFYGSRRMTAWLSNHGHQVNRKRVRRLMQLIGLEAIYRRPNTSKPNPGHKVYPYLLRGLEINRVNQVWATDITYIPMARGFLYLVAIMDWHSRYVLAWRLSNTLEVDFCVAALEEALSKGRPQIFNTDQGSQFTSEAFTRIHRRYDVAAAEWVMRGKGRRWSGHDSGKWGRCLSSAAAGRPCDRLGTLGRARWRGEDAARGARGADWREFAGTFGWADGGSVADGRRQAGSGIARSRARARLNWVSQGQRCGRCRVRRRAERVSRPTREKNRRRRVLVVAICSPRPAPSSGPGCGPSPVPASAVGGEAAGRHVVQTDAVLEVSNGVLDLGVAAVVGLQFQGLSGPVGDEAVIAVGGEEGQLGTGRGLHPPDDEPHRCGAGLSLEGGVSRLATSAAPSIQ